jgi:hypothetical protein
MNWRQIIILVQFDFLHTIFRLKGLLFLIPFLFFWYGLFYLLIKQGTEFLVSQQSFVITAWFFNPETAQSLLLLNPPTLSVFLILSLATMPFFVMLAGNNQLSSDASNKTFRYLLTRCTRLEIFLARFISAYLLMVITTICVGVIATIISLQYDSHAIPETSQYAVQIILMTLLYALPFFAYMSAISAFMSSALGTLLMSMVIYIFLIIFSHYMWEEFSLLPSYLKDTLLVSDTSKISIAILGLLTYTLVYASLGWAIFRKRNL